MSSNKQAKRTPAVVAPVTPVTPVDPVVAPVVETPAVDVVEAELALAGTAPESEPTVEDTAPEPIAEAVAPEPEPEPVVPPLELWLRKRFPTMDVVPNIVRVIESQLETYITHMQRTQVLDEERGITLQTNLYSIYLQALAAPNGDHYAGLETILFYFYTYRREVFSQSLVFRLSGVLRLYKQQAMSWADLNTLFLATCDPSKRRDGLRTINIERIIKGLPDNTYRQNLLSFYKS